MIKDLPLEIMKARVAVRRPEEEMIPLLLFRGNLNMGRALALYNFVLMMKDAEVPTTTEAVKISHKSHSLNHLAGLHHHIGQVSTLYSILSRIYYSPVVNIEPGMGEYIEHLANQRPFMLTPLEPIARYNKWSKRAWRRKNGRVRKRKNQFDADTGIIKPEFWPFVTENGQQEHDLMMAVHELVPRMPKYVREDLCQDILVGLLAEEVTLDNIQSELPKYVRQAWKEQPSKYMISLDQPPPWDDHGRTLGESLFADMVSDVNMEHFKKAIEREKDAQRLPSRKVTQEQLDEAYTFTFLDEMGIKRLPENIAERFYNIIDWCADGGMHPSKHALEEILGYDYDGNFPEELTDEEHRKRWIKEQMEKPRPSSSQSSFPSSSMMPAPSRRNSNARARGGVEVPHKIRKQEEENERQFEELMEKKLSKTEILKLNAG